MSYTDYETNICVILKCTADCFQAKCLNIKKLGSEALAKELDRFSREIRKQVHVFLNYTVNKMPVCSI